MSYFKIRPEVAGQIGEGSILDTSVRPMKVERLGVIGRNVCMGWACQLLPAQPERAHSPSSAVGAVP